MKLVVTGALGHIGSRLIHALLPDEYREVVLVDDLATQRQNVLFNLAGGIRWRFIEADVTSATARLDEIFAGAHAVVHLAAMTNAEASFDMKARVERVNYEGTERVARACVAAGCRLLFASTTSIYGVSSGVVSEDCPPEQLKPQSPYAESKLRAEQMLADLGHRLLACDQLRDQFGMAGERAEHRDLFVLRTQPSFDCGGVNHRQGCGGRG